VLGFVLAAGVGSGGVRGIMGGRNEEREKRKGKEGGVR